MKYQKNFYHNGIEKFLDYYPNKLSGGVQKSSLSKIFATQPQLLILDEPFTSLDELPANLLRKMLLELWAKQPTTIIFNTRHKRSYCQIKLFFI